MMTKKFYEIPCPDCCGVCDDEQYTCTTCWCEGGNGVLKLYSESKTDKINISFDSDDAKGEVEIVKVSDGIVVQVDGKDIVFVDLFYRVEENKWLAEKHDFESIDGVSVISAEPESCTRIVVLPEMEIK